MNNKICILGNDSIYTKMICKEFDEHDIIYTLILEKSSLKNEIYFSKLCSILIKLDNLLNSGKFKALSKLNTFTFRLLVEDFLFKKSARYKAIVKPYRSYLPKTENIYFVPYINHVKTNKIIEDLNFDIGVFGGVGIVDSLIIDKFNKFCLNAHPAPLPECRGGGALENTLFYNLKPSVSVHFGTAGIDEGKIIKVNELKLSKDDCFNSISNKLTVLCAKSLVEIIVCFENNIIPLPKDNKGKMHYWKDCNISIQKIARNNLKKLLSKLSDQNNDDNLITSQTVNFELTIND